MVRPGCFKTSSCWNGQPVRCSGAEASLSETWAGFSRWDCGGSENCLREHDPTAGAGFNSSPKLVIWEEASHRFSNEMASQPIALATAWRDWSFADMFDLASHSKGVSKSWQIQKRSLWFDNIDKVSRILRILHCEFTNLLATRNFLPHHSPKKVSSPMLLVSLAIWHQSPSSL